MDWTRVNDSDCSGPPAQIASDRVQRMDIIYLRTIEDRFSTGATNIWTTLFFDIFCNTLLPVHRNMCYPSLLILQKVKIIYFKLLLIIDQVEKFG